MMPRDLVPVDVFEIMFFISLDRRRSKRRLQKASLVRESDGTAYTTEEGTYRRPCDATGREARRS